MVQQVLIFISKPAKRNGSKSKKKSQLTNEDPVQNRHKNSIGSKKVWYIVKVQSVNTMMQHLKTIMNEVLNHAQNAVEHSYLRASKGISKGVMPRGKRLNKVKLNNFHLLRDQRHLSAISVEGNMDQLAWKFI